MRTFQLLFFSILTVLITSCHSSVKNNDTSSEKQDSILAWRRRISEQEERISAEQKVLREKKEREKKHAQGIYEAGDTAWFGEIQVLLDKVIEKKVSSKGSSMLTGKDRDYDIYMTLTNTSKDQKLTLPYLFMKRKKDTSLYVGTHSFVDQKTGKQLEGKALDILPGKTLKGYYMISSEKGTDSFYLSYGNTDIPEGYKAKDRIDIPEGYENEKVTIYYKDKLVPEEE